jgi:DNA-binding transcriptional LysR family regulator
MIHNMIKLEALRVFTIVAEMGNIRDAADRLCRTASAVSMALKQLEEEIGGRLFETDRKNSLTTLGSFVLETGDAQIRSFDKSVDMMLAHAQSRIGRLSLASVPSVATNLIPTLLPVFLADRPGLDIELFDIDSASVAAMVEAGRAELGIGGQPKSRTNLIFSPLFVDRFKLVCSAASPLSRSSTPLHWEDLEKETLIVNGASQIIQSPEYRMASESSSLKVRNVTSLFAMARAGLGVTLLPALATTDLPDGVVALDIIDIDAERVIGFIAKRGSSVSPVASAFRELMAETMPQFINDLGLSSPKPGPEALDHS